MADHVSLTTYLSELSVLPPEPSCEPELDDKDEKKDREMRSALTANAWTKAKLSPLRSLTVCREAEDLANGCVMTGILEKGTGTTSPVEGDLVCNSGYLHACNVRTCLALLPFRLIASFYCSNICQSIIMLPWLRTW